MITVEQVLPILDSYNQPNIMVLGGCLGFFIVGLIGFIFASRFSDKSLVITISVVMCVLSGTAFIIGLPVFAFQRPHTTKKAKDIVHIINHRDYEVMTTFDGYIISSGGTEKKVTAFNKEKTILVDYMSVHLSVDEAINLERIINENITTP